jgi:ElaB/YqjD/DUF883 family membrane-anchored ribosome-binding protein
MTPSSSSSTSSTSYPSKSSDLSSSGSGLSGSSSSKDYSTPEQSSSGTLGNAGASLSGVSSKEIGSSSYDSMGTKAPGAYDGSDAISGNGNYSPASADALKSKAQEFAQATMNTAKDLTGRAWHGASDTVKRCEMYVQERPLQSALIAVGVGAALMLLVTSRHSRHY